MTQPTPSLRDLLPLFTASAYKLVADVQELSSLTVDAARLGASSLQAHLMDALASLKEPSAEERDLTPAEEILVASGVHPADITHLTLELLLERTNPLKAREADHLVADLTTHFAQEGITLEHERTLLDAAAPTALVSFALEKSQYARFSLKSLPLAFSHPTLGSYSARLA